MAITYASYVFTCSGAATEAELQAVVDANPTVGMYEAGACIFRNSQLSVPNGASLTCRKGEVLVFDDAFITSKPYVAYGGMLTFPQGGGITINANVGYSFLQGLSGANIVYRVNSTAISGARVDFFDPYIASSGLTNITLVAGGGGNYANLFTHLENLAGKINGLTMVNDVRVGAGGAASGVNWNVQFGDGVYNAITFAPLTSGYGITITAALYFAWSGGTSTLTNPVFRGTSVSVFGDPVVLGKAIIVNEKWPDSATPGTFDMSPPGSSVRTEIYRNFEWSPGTLYDAASPVTVRIVNGSGAEVYAASVTSAAPTRLLWQRQMFADATPVGFNPFTLLARRKDLVDMSRTFTMVAPQTESFVRTPDPNYTADASKYPLLACFVVNRAVTVSGVYTLDQLYDYIKYWLALPENMVSVPVSFLSASGTEMLLGDWRLLVQPGAKLSAGSKLKSIKTTGIIVNAGVITCVYTSNAGTVARLTIAGFPSGSDVVVLAAGTNTVLVAVDQVSGTSYDYVYTYNGAASVDIGIIKPGYVPLYIRGYALTASAATLPVSLVTDRVYQ